MAKVAVVIPVFNVKDYLKECLESVLNQTLKDILVILVNDGSTDGSLDLLKYYAKKDSRIILIDKDNSGYGDTMNVGIDRAIAENSEYIAFMDPDDYIALDGYEKLYTLAHGNNLDVLRANITSVIPSENGEVTYFKNDSLRLFPELYNKLINIRENKEIFTMNSNCGGLFKTEFLKKNNIRHNTTPGAAYQDIGFWFQAYALSESFYFSSDRYYFYRRERPGSSENGKKDKDIIFKEYSFIYDFLNQNTALKSEFIKQYYIAKYRSLYWYFHLLQKEYRSDFVHKISNDFNKAIQNREFLLEDAKNVSEYLYTIIIDPEKFLIMKEMEEQGEKKSPLVVPK